MLELTRTVRFAINDLPNTDAPPHATHPATTPTTHQPSRTGFNTFAGSPSLFGLGRHYELDVTCRGHADPATGYFVNIREIDHAVRSAAVPMIQAACRETPMIDPAIVLARLIDPIEAVVSSALDRADRPTREPRDTPVRVVSRVRWRLTPYHSIEMATTPAPSSPSSPPCVLMRQQFEFAASHRLHSPQLTDEQNRALFGKCNLPSGHGHNYRVEPCVAIPFHAAGPARFTLLDLERITSERIIHRFDHKHLNLDTAEFACGEAGSGSGNGSGTGGLNPSVENIVKVCFDLLAPAIAGTNTGATLRSMTVWETDKTSCTYPG